VKYAALVIFFCFAICAKAPSQTTRLSDPFICEWANTPGGCPNGNYLQSANCGPASVLMIADKYNGTLPVASDLDLMDTWLQSQFAPNYSANAPFGSGTNITELAALSAQYFNLPNSVPFSNWTLGQLQNELQQGYPIIVYVETWMMTHAQYDGHYMVLLGMDSQNVYVNDPGRSGGGGVSYPLQNFVAAWAMHSNAGVSIHSNTTVSLASNQWTWMGGGQTAGQSGIYGVQGLSAASNVPGARDSSVSWRDAGGNFWLFGGEELQGGTPDFNDLWEYSPPTNQWTWVNGSNSTSSSGSFGIKGVASISNVPPARGSAAGWTDRNGNLWLFGGYGDNGDLNDLWQFSMAPKEWIWTSGSNVASALGAYGTLGVPSSNNVPAARSSAANWIDNSGNLWLFGGFSYETFGTMNDLWMFSPASGNWTWQGGSNSAGARGTYGALGSASSTNVPGARSSPLFWTDMNGNFWLFGGIGVDSAGNNGVLNDLWEFTPTTKQWTWVKGASVVGQTGSYGTQGVASNGSTPGARLGGTTWTDGAGNLWLFGGDSLGAQGSLGWLNDFWRYSPSSNQWAWIGGANTIGTTCVIFGTQKQCGRAGIYGQEGTAAAGNQPGSRGGSAAWVDSGGALWFFGGYGFDSGGNLGELSDLWRYYP